MECGVPRSYAVLMIQWHSLIVFLALTLSSAPAGAIDQEAPPTPRNLVWITIEDMSPWLGCYGDRTVPTPNLDRLAAEGVRYTNAFATTPVCAPSRSTLITGCWATRIGSMHMRTGKPSAAAIARHPDAYLEIPDYEAVPPPAVRCFPELLRAAGWYCTNRAKTDYQFKAPGTTWDRSGRRAHWRRRPHADQPFFAVFNLVVTHESGTFARRKRQPRVCDPDTVAVPPYLPDSPRTRNDIARTYDNIAVMDRQVGILIDELEQAGLLDDTVVMVFSDHGVGLPRGKRCVYDSGTRVPLIIRWPDAGHRGQVEDRVVSFEDFAPTALSILGVAPPSWMDGIAFAGEFEAADDGFAYLHADRMDAVRDRTRAITDGRYRYVRNLMPDRPRLYDVAYSERIPMKAEVHALRASGDATPAQWQLVEPTKPSEEFYDLRHDPHEVRNLIANPLHAARIRIMQKALDAWIRETGDLGLIEDEGEMVRTRLWNDAVRKPATAPAILTVVERDGGRRAEISCPTEGASIGFRWNWEKAWTPANGLIALPPEGGILELLTHRIGFEPRILRWSISPAG
ncbi:MAG: sulfatase [Phycisphaerae bacterium]|nr:sulfatase [Phycisphaerae bacterium]